MTVYRIADVAFDPDACEIIANGETQHLQPQVRSVLLCLVKHKGEVVPKDLLIAEAWGGRRTSDESVTRCISLLRQHFADRGERHLIETIPKSGYRLHASVSMESAAPAQVHSAELQHAPHDDTKTAVNLVVTAAVLALLLSGLVVASDFFTLN